AYGDIAIDNLAFYGSTEAGTPDYTYYRDSDGDGFGDPNQRVTLCSPDIPPGYVLIDSDCNDADSTIYPGAPEILCNQKDENCNGMSDDSTIDAPTGQGDELCAGETATLLANGTPAGQFYWFAGPQSAVPLASGTQLILNGLTGSGTYYLADSISSANGGCSSPRIPVQVIVHPAPNIAAANAPGICQGQSVDLNAIAVTDSAGTGGMLSWHFAYPPNAGNIATSPVQPSVSATFYAQVLADYGCFDVDSVFIAVHPNPAVQIAQGDSISICRGKTITLNATGQGTAPLSYAWSNGLNFPNIPVAASPVPGTTNAYTVTVTDANGCQSLDFIQVHTLNNVTQTAIENIHHPSVCGGTDGSITLHPLNGVPPYAFAWSGPTSGTMGGIGGAATITGLKQGGYRVTVTDATSGCSMVLPQIVLSAPGLSVSIDTIIGNRCPGEENGSIALNVSGTSPAYLWSNGQTTSSIDDLAGGVYSVTISDGNCTQVIANLEVAEPSPLQIIENGIQQVLCNGAASGAIDIAVFGASPPYIFAWSNGANTEDIGGLTAGGYSVTITDSKDCAFSSDIYSIVQPEPLDVSGPASQQIDCHGENSGSISLTISGGKAPYQIHWNNGATSGNLENLPAGNYQATVTDANGCTRLFSTNITQPTAISIDDISTNDPACVGSTDGDITLTVSGGTGPYHFNWSSGQSGMGMNSIIGLIAGIYAVTIEDALGCIYLQDNIDLDAPQLLTLNLETLQPVSCFGTSNGAITVSVAGAEGALNILWNGQPGGLTLGAIPAGPYLLQISDARGCSIRDSFLLPQPKSPLIATLLSAQNALCSKEPNGSIQVFTSGGTPPYTYHWSNNATTEDLPAIAAGDYTLSVTDANGCTAMLGPVAITEPPALIALPAIQDIPCFGTPTGSIEMAVSGGIPPYSYTWSTGESTPNIYFLPAGNYSVTIIDATGCARILADLPVIDKGAEFSVEIIDYQPVSCPGADDGKIIAMASNGTAPYQFSWSPPVGLHANVPSPVDQATGLSGGVYAVTLTDAAGCSAVSLDLLIEEAPQVFFSVVSKTDVLCKGDSTGNVTISLSGGLPPNSFLWSNGANTPDLSGVPAGTYSLTVTDFLNCTLVSTPVTISQPAAVLQITVDSILQDRCGQDQGAVFLKVKGGTFPYQYTWSNGPQTANITGLAAGTYQLTATDHVGCKVVSPVFEIQALATPLGITSNVTPVKCFGDSSGAISVMASGGTPDYSYFWNNGQAGPMIGQLPAGTYMLTLTDEAGCTDVFNFPVSQPASPLVAIAQIDSLSGGWTISLDISGGTGAYEVLWDAGAGGQTGPEVSGLEPGHYTATITDDNGCVLVLNIFAGVTGTDQPSLVRAIRLYPNPSTGPASLDLDLYENTGFVWSILDGTGRLVQTELVEEKSTHHRISIDLNGRPEGLYFVKITLPAGEMRSLPLVKTGK
ncbi:MAG: hypothetical protein KDC70_01915, partial [Saprospiraceae bacterium]|nr:hypothetical protein [Saprospiraceae bacterium]